METLLNYVKTTIIADATLSGYVKKTEITAPRTLPEVKTSQVPWIGIAPVNSPEQWATNKKKKASHTVEIYAVTWLQLRETAIVGSGTLKGITDIARDISSAIRGEKFSGYLSAPTDIQSVDYATAGYGDQLYLLVATITLNCQRLFDV